MKAHSRYEIIGRLAKGDYATVYRAKDLELDREVAVKQIHQQYLEDPQQLDRYWQEAQLLAKLEHPRIMTIYDIVRERGWLVLELMQGSLSEIQNGAPIDLNVLRLALTCGLQALQFLSQNGIVHGDVKPSNLLADKNNRIKLGDFGIARRMTGDPGSILKGTTKYMAPEVLSDQFGPVGPHSDLYSLGFSAYELMCGSHFDSLFPGLDMFGRDRQMAWMMWHSSPDRRLPEISRVLQGVPDDLTFVIQKLVEKDPKKRYRTAQEVLQDLQSLGKGAPPAESAQVLEEAKELAGQAKRKRLLLFAALGVSVALSLAMLFFTGGKKPAAEPEQVDQVEAGVVEDVKPGEHRFHVSPADGGDSQTIPVGEHDTVLLNSAEVGLAKLEPGDKVKIEYFTNTKGEKTKKISATRAEAERDSGVISGIDVSSAQVTISLGTGGKSLELKVPSTTKFTLNEEARLGAKPVELGDLRKGDRVEISHVADGTSRAAISLRASRKASLAGSVTNIDKSESRIEISSGTGSTAKRKWFSLDENCPISLNGVTTLASQTVGLADLRAGDSVQIEYEARVSKITATRVYSVTGVMQGLPEAASFAVKLETAATPVKFTLAPDCRIESAGTGEAVDLADLRPGDKLQITHDSPDLKNPQASAVKVVEAYVNKSSWAVVVVQRQYDDKSLAEIEHGAADGQTLRTALLARYRIPKSQLLYQENASRPTLERELDQFLRNVPPEAQLVVYYLGHGHLTPAGSGLLAPPTFEAARADETGMTLKSLVQRLEDCRAKEKVLLLDACHGSESPSSEELVLSLRAPGGTKVSSSVTLIASCSTGQAGAVVEQAGTSLSALAAVTAFAFGGKADLDGNRKIDVGELSAFIKTEFDALASEGSERVTPVRFTPINKKERITEGGKAAIRKLMGHLAVKSSDPRVLADDFKAADGLCPNEPEPTLALGLVLLKQNKGGDSVKHFEGLIVKHPEIGLAPLALAFHRLGQGNTPAGANDLAQLVRSLHGEAKGKKAVDLRVYMLHMAGRLSRYAETVAEKRQSTRFLKAELDGLDAESLAHFNRGQKFVEDKIKEIDALIEVAQGSELSTLRTQRKQVVTYTNKFNFTLATEYFEELLTKE